MPQLWLTYDEIAAEFGCPRGDVRRHAEERQLVRKRSRDGLTRILMTQDMRNGYMAGFLSRAEAIDRQSDEMVAMLRSVLQAAAEVEASPHAEARSF